MGQFFLVLSVINITIGCQKFDKKCWLFPWKYINSGV